VEPIYEGGLGWLVYVIAAFALVVVLSSHGAPNWLIHLVIATEILAVPPLYWTFHRDTQSGQTSEISIGDVASVLPVPDVAIPAVEAADLLRSDAEDPAGRDARGAPGRGGRR
jgi:hypothetical protein